MNLVLIIRKFLLFADQEDKVIHGRSSGRDKRGTVNGNILHLYSNYALVKAVAVDFWPKHLPLLPRGNSFRYRRLEEKTRVQLEYSKLDVSKHLKCRRSVTMLL
jgi:hypothetical protein